MKITIAQQNYIAGDFKGNYQKMLDAISQAVEEHSDIIVFPELATTASPVGDLLRYDYFIQKTQGVLHHIAQFAQDKIAVIIGSVLSTVDGQNVQNAAIFIESGQVKWASSKLIADNEIFDESRYFSASYHPDSFEYKGKRILLTVGEYLEDTLEHVQAPFEIVFNVAASPYSQGVVDRRVDEIKRVAQNYDATVIYCNQVGGHADVVFDGGSLVCNPQGKIVAELEYYKEDVQTISLEDIESYRGDDKSMEIPEIARIHEALLLGIRDYFSKSGFTQAVVGLSGGVDSALVVTLAAQALGPENVLSVLMPSPYSSEHSITDSEALVANLGSPHIVIPIEDSYRALESSLSPHFEGKPADVTEENLQARIRGLLLMAISNKHGHILLNPTNKSEVAVGYGTLYGDMNGAIGVIGDLYKTQVYELCKYINRDEEIIPRNILTKAPSAELRPDQLDSDSLPDYDTLDDILYRYIELSQSPNEIIENGHDKATVERIIQLVNRGEFKRKQTPPYLRVSTKGFGMGRRMPIVAQYQWK